MQIHVLMDWYWLRFKIRFNCVKEITLFVTKVKRGSLSLHRHRSYPNASIGSRSSDVWSWRQISFLVLKRHWVKDVIQGEQRAAWCLSAGLITSCCIFLSAAVCCTACIERVNKHVREDEVKIQNYSSRVARLTRNPHKGQCKIIEMNPGILENNPAEVPSSRLLSWINLVRICFHGLDKAK